MLDVETVSSADFIYMKSGFPKLAYSFFSICQKLRKTCHSVTNCAIWAQFVSFCSSWGALFTHTNYPNQRFQFFKIFALKNRVVSQNCLNRLNKTVLGDQRYFFGLGYKVPITFFFKVSIT